jgi:hypothetical protein
VKHLFLTAALVLAPLTRAPAAQDRPAPEPAPAPRPVELKPVQEKPGYAKPAGEKPEVAPLPGAKEKDDGRVVPIRTSQAQQEMVELFGKVERTLKQIDDLLRDASSPPPAAAGGAASALARKLEQAQKDGEEVRKSIDRIIELAQQCNPSPGGGGGGQQRQQQEGEGQSPLDRQGEQSTGRESTPAMPQRGQGEPQPQGEQEKPGAEQKKQDQQGRTSPDDPRGSKQDPFQQPGGEPRSGAKGGASGASDGKDRWGDLPVHAREVFRSEGGRDLPPLYRDWIDSYYRRLNKKP